MLSQGIGAEGLYFVLCVCLCQTFYEETPCSHIIQAVVHLIREYWHLSHRSVFLIPFNAMLLQKCQWECQTWITNEMSGTKTATRTEESVRMASLLIDWNGIINNINMWGVEYFKWSNGSAFKVARSLFSDRIWALNRAIVLTCVFLPLSVSNTRFIAAVIERHTHTPERRRRYWGRSGTESDHGKTNDDKKSVNLTLLHWLMRVGVNTWWCYLQPVVVSVLSFHHTGETELVANEIKLMCQYYFCHL